MKNVKDAALFLKNNIVCDIPDLYDINNILKDGLHDVDIRKGVKEFQLMLNLLLDHIIDNADEQEAVNETDRTSLSFEKTFPDLIYPIYMLYCIGLRGRLDNNGCMAIDGSSLYTAFKEIHGSKPNQHLLFLSDLGFMFSRADITSQSFKLNQTGLLEIQYPDSHYTLTGLKIMAEAASRIGKSHKDKSAISSVFMRCDYHALALPKKFFIHINDCVNAVQTEYKSFFMKLNEFLLSNGCKCETKYQMNEFIFTYTSKVSKTVVFSIHISIEGSYVKLNSKLINETPAFMSEAPDSIREAVKNGWNCAKLEDPNACNPKCKNLRFTMDGKEYQKCRCLNFNLPIHTNADREYIEIWLTKELAMI